MIDKSLGTAWIKPKTRMHPKITKNIFIIVMLRQRWSVRNWQQKMNLTLFLYIFVYINEVSWASGGRGRKRKWNMHVLSFKKYASIDVIFCSFILSIWRHALYNFKDENSGVFVAKAEMLSLAIQYSHERIAKRHFGANFEKKKIEAQQIVMLFCCFFTSFHILLVSANTWMGTLASAAMPSQKTRLLLSNLEKWPQFGQSGHGNKGSQMHCFSALHVKEG